ncbi:unnamed protein product [Rotaria socialis]|uniref:Uncharacterized protein n=1 Tax=Rotaria socialis TaxID=392032 RepID=A0A817XJW5_9BILA|nr:unnamed protein product [Rotaria socialis]
MILHQIYVAMIIVFILGNSSLLKVSFTLCTVIVVGYFTTVTTESFARETWSNLIQDVSLKLNDYKSNEKNEKDNGFGEGFMLISNNRQQSSSKKHSANRLLLVNRISTLNNISSTTCKTITKAENSNDTLLPRKIHADEQLHGSLPSNTNDIVPRKISLQNTPKVNDDLDINSYLAVNPADLSRQLLEDVSAYGGSGDKTTTMSNFTTSIQPNEHNSTVTADIYTSTNSASTAPTTDTSTSITPESGTMPTVVTTAGTTDTTYTIQITLTSTIPGSTITLTSITETTTTDTRTTEQLTTGTGATDTTTTGTGTTETTTTDTRTTEPLTTGTGTTETIPTGTGTTETTITDTRTTEPLTTGTGTTETIPTGTGTIETTTTGTGTAETITMGTGTSDTTTTGTGTIETTITDTRTTEPLTTGTGTTETIPTGTGTTETITTDTSASDTTTMGTGTTQTTTARTGTVQTTTTGTGTAETITTGTGTVQTTTTGTGTAETTTTGTSPTDTITTGTGTIQTTTAGTGTAVVTTVAGTSSVSISGLTSATLWTDTASSTTPASTSISSSTTRVTSTTARPIVAIGLSNSTILIVKVNCTSVNNNVSGLYEKINSTLSGKYHFNITPANESSVCDGSGIAEVSLEFPNDYSISDVQDILSGVRNVTSVLVADVTSCFLINACNLCGLDPVRGRCETETGDSKCRCYQNQNDASRPYVGDFCEESSIIPIKADNNPSWVPIIVGILAGLAGLFFAMTCCLWFVAGYRRRRNHDKDDVLIFRRWHLPRAHVPTPVSNENNPDYMNSAMSTPSSSRTYSNPDQTSPADSTFFKELDQKMGENLRATIARPNTSAMLASLPSDTISLTSSFDPIDELDSIIDNEDLNVTFHDPLNDLFDDDDMLEAINPNVMLPRPIVDSKPSGLFSV